MKKTIKMSMLLMLLVVLLTGCKGKEVKTICKSSSNQTASDYKTNLVYTIYSSNDLVNRIELNEVIESKNNTVLAYYEKQLQELYKSNNDLYKGYDYKITNKDGKVTAKVTIDYSKMDMKKFVTENPAMKDFVNKDNKLLLEGAKAMYESSGATCDK